MHVQCATQGQRSFLHVLFYIAFSVALVHGNQSQLSLLAMSAHTTQELRPICTHILSIILDNIPLISSSVNY